VEQSIPPGDLVNLGATIPGLFGVPVLPLKPAKQ
jgi:hypothetical protein